MQHAKSNLNIWKAKDVTLLMATNHKRKNLEIRTQHSQFYDAKEKIQIDTMEEEQSAQNKRYIVNV